MRTFIPIFMLFSSLVWGDYSVEVLSKSPRIMLIHNFLTDEECEYFIREASPNLERAVVVDPEGDLSDGLVVDQRTSDGAYLENFDDPILHRVEKRIARLTKTSIDRGEPLQVLHYKKGGEFKPHYDYFDTTTAGGKECTLVGGQRYASLVMYLNTPVKGGETVFPEAGIKVIPKKGEALLFYNCHPEGEPDPMSLHGGAPVVEGEKWIVNKWIRMEKYR